MNEQYWGRSAVVGVVAVVALSGAVACSDGFSSSGCKAARTCPVAGSESASGGDASRSDGGAPSSNPPSAGGTDAIVAAGQPAGGAADSAPTAGEGGVASVGCRVAKDCSNDDPSDGEEVCDNGTCVAGNVPPTVVAVTPNDRAVDVEPNGDVVIEFSEPLDPTTVIAANIQLLDDATTVPGKLSYTDGKVTFKPTAPLTLLAPYTLSVTTALTDADGVPLVKAFSSQFSIRDGAWKTIDVVKDKLNGLSDALPMTSAGNVLVAWSGAAGSLCPVSARWFVRGAASTASKAFTVANQTECNGVTSGGNVAGVGAVAWNEPDAANGSDIQQFRADAWQATPTLVSKNTNAFHFRLAVAPSGVATFFEHLGGSISKAWITDATGKWPSTGDMISAYDAESRTSVAFDTKGNGLAVWAAKDAAGTQLQRIVATRFTTAKGKWAMVTDLPGSVAAAASFSTERGTPAIAVDSMGDALALWVNASSGGKLMASRYSQVTGWADAESISGALLVEALQDPPGLVFDGQAYVAAWTAQDAGKRYTYTARYDLQTGWSSYQKQQATAADGTSAARMPRIVSDGRGNAIVVFAKGSSPTYTFMYQRYTAGAWSAPKALAGGTVTNKFFETNDVLPMSISSSGLAALAWANYDNENYISGIRLASFY